MSLTDYYRRSGPIGISVYRLSSRRAWVELAGWCVIVVPHDAADPGGKLLQRPCVTRRRLFKQYTTKPPKAAFELTLRELKAWAKRRGGKLDRQRILGGIYDRAWLRESLRWLDRNRVPLDAKVRLEAAQSPAHEPGNHVLVMRCDDWLACLMCCAEGTKTGSDPLPIGRAA